MRRTYYSRTKQRSALIFVLKGLIPYSKENMLLAFKPNAFFNELEKISEYKRWTLEKAYYEARRQKLIVSDANVVSLTEAGKKIIKPYIAQRLAKDARLMVIFDIPEDQAVIRAKFRRILKLWNFRQVQKSVWITSYDHKDSIKEVVAELGLENFVELYECSPL